MDIAYAGSLTGVCLKVVMEMVVITWRDNESSGWDLHERKLGLELAFVKLGHFYKDTLKLSV